MRRSPSRPCCTLRRSILLVLTAVVASVTPIALQALPARAADETQVPLDRAGRIEVIDRWLARRLDLFLDRYPYLEEVRLLQATDSVFVLEIAQRQDGRRTRARFPFTAREADSLRALVGARVAERAPEAGRDQSGRPLLMGGSAALGLGFYAWAVPTLMDLHGGEDFTGTYMLTAAASILLPGLLTQRADVSFPAADLALYGATRGIAHGALLYDGLAQDGGGNGALGAALAGSLVEGAALGVWAQATHASDGVAGTINTGGDLGLLYGLGIADLTDRHGGEHDGAIAALTVGGSGLGMAGGHWLAKHRDYTYGDAGVMRTAGLVGGYLGLALARGRGRRGVRAGHGGGDGGQRAGARGGGRARAPDRPDRRTDGHRGPGHGRGRPVRAGRRPAHGRGRRRSGPRHPAGERAGRGGGLRRGLHRRARTRARGRRTGGGGRLPRAAQRPVLAHRA